MPKRKAQLDSEKFSCSICLDLLRSPVAVPCGHSFCIHCIKTHWDKEVNKGLYSCPLCRKRFRPRPDLNVNIMLADLVEDLKKILYCAGPEDVGCDVCTTKKRKAIKSCVVCLVSYCEEHLQHHFEADQLKKHKLVEPSNRLRERICSLHGEVMEIFCRNDQQCICYQCALDQHRKHEMVPVEVERIEKQKELEANRVNIQRRTKERQKDIEMLQQQMEAINASTDEAVEHSAESFNQMVRLILKSSCEVKQKLRSQQQTAVSGIKYLKGKLEQELAQLKKKDVQLEELALTGDHCQFLHSYPSMSELGEPTDSIQTSPPRYFKDMAAAVSDTKKKLQEILSEIGTNLSLRAMEEELLLPRAQPETRDNFLQYSQQISLDPNTAQRHLVLSDRNRKATFTREDQLYPDHTDRFTLWPQVLSKESLTGRCYWEVEWSETVYVAVTYKNISRAGNTNECGLGCNDKSWALCCYSNTFIFYHNNKETPISGPWSSRVGVYLDHKAGILSFYSVSGTMTLLHRVQTTFTEPLHAGVNVLGSAKFVKPQKRSTLSSCVVL